MTIATAGHAAPGAAHAHAHEEDCGCRDSSCDPPTPLERNAFFPRKLMEVRHWRAEQRYHRRSRELVTRLATGSGVLCGLGVFATDARTIVIESGVAVDGRGRIIVVPEDIEVDPARLSDDCGRPADKRIDEGVVTVALCYRECGTDVVAIPSQSCEGETTCVPSMIREAFAVTVTEGAVTRRGLPPGVCDALHDDSREGEEDREDEEDREGREDRRLVLDRLAPRDCACDDECVPLAVVTIDAEGIAADTAVTTVIRSNRELLDLILCLADRMDDCCGGRPTVAAPRITALWPQPDATGAVLSDFAHEQRIEIAFDRDMSEQGLGDPSSWLGAWVLRRDGATRLELRRSSDPLVHVTAPPGGDAAAYEVVLDPRSMTFSAAGRATSAPATAVALIMVRSTAAGVIRAAEADHLALDGEHAATALDQTQRDKLWQVLPGSKDASLGALAAAAVPVPAPPLPSGDGAPAGELHIVLQRPRKAADPPRLLAVAPAGGTVLSRETAESAREWKRFLGDPRLTITVSRVLTADAVAKPGAWLRAWHGTQDGDFLYSVREILLGEGIAQELADGSVAYAFPLPEYQPFLSTEQILVQLRADASGGPAAPAGDSDGLLLDADFRGTALPSQTLLQLWSGTPALDDMPVLDALPTGGVTMFDGSEGEFAHWGFTVVH